MLTAAILIILLLALNVLICYTALIASEEDEDEPIDVDCMWK